MFEFSLLLTAIYCLTYTQYIPWEIVWIFSLPVPLFVLLIVYENFLSSLSNRHVLLKAVLGTLAILSTGYIGLYADVSSALICSNDNGCPHGSSRQGTGEYVNSLCKCLDSSWFKKLIRWFMFSLCTSTQHSNRLLWQRAHF